MIPGKPIRVKVTRRKQRVSGRGNKFYDRRKKSGGAFEEPPEATFNVKA